MLTTDVESYDKLSLDQRSQMRRIMLCVSDTIDKVVKMPGVSADDQRLLKKLKSDMLSTIEYAPVWIIMAVALALGIGTMIGWRRVATTIGEKIGKKGMTYAQGMSAQMTCGSVYRPGELYRDAGFHYSRTLLFCRGDDGGRWWRLTA